MTDINETIRLAESGAQSVERLRRDAEYDRRLAHLLVEYDAQAAAIRALCAEASETCEWRQSTEGSALYSTSCGILTIGALSYKFCPYCGKRVTETKHKEEGK